MSAQDTHPHEPTPGGVQLAAGVGLLMMSRAAIASGLRVRPGGWRRAAGLVLRSPRSDFVLSAFGLDVWSDEPLRRTGDAAVTQARVAARLDAHLNTEADSCVIIRRLGHEDRAEPSEGPNYSLAFERWEDGLLRFVRPKEWGCGPAGAGMALPPLLRFVCRVGPQGQADLWVRVNHVGADGVPVQEILSRLETAWGLTERVVFPAPTEWTPRVEPCDDPGISETQAFIDFSPLIEWRKTMNASLSESMTLAAAIIWCLGRRAEFQELHIGSTVEVGAVGGLARGVGVVVARPGRHAPDRGGLAAYVRDFNRQVGRTRRRESGSCRTLDAAGLLPPRIARSLLRHALERDPRAFGNMALTMLKDAKVFGAPIGAFGHPRGFIAVGSVDLPTRDGRRVGCVTIKGNPEVISNYPAVIDEAIRTCANT